MKSKTIMNAFDLYYALSAADIALRDLEDNKKVNLSAYRIPINDLKNQIRNMNTTGDIKIKMERKEWTGKLEEN